MNKMMILSALASLCGTRNLTVLISTPVLACTISVSAFRTPCTASQTHHFERFKNE